MSDDGRPKDEQSEIEKAREWFKEKMFAGHFDIDVIIVSTRMDGESRKHYLRQTFSSYQQQNQKPCQEK